ncbi:MAG: 1-phosphofructokinase family hexose kinase [Deferribacteraceae bacterium]|jgi:1-phosphofructokinase|nr:1-phosphofructokinase family hexose kinase [Deferribacteraceae bacterium]
MIITVTLNPALDKTASVDVMRANELNRLQNVRVDAGGKGVNVSSIIHALGGKSVAVGFAGGGAGDELRLLIANKSLHADLVRIAATTRTNLKVMDEHGLLTELNEPGPAVTKAEWQNMEEKLLSYAQAGNIIVLSGSLPSTAEHAGFALGKDTYQKLSKRLRKCGAAVFLDADGEAFKLALESGKDEVPNFIKPNRFELLQYFGLPDDESVNEAKLIELCQIMLAKGVELVALSMGGDGAIFVNKNGAWKSAALPINVQSTVGAGDSMTGALVYGFEQGLKETDCFALAMAASAGACTTKGTNPPSKALIDELLTKTMIEKIG